MAYYYRRTALLILFGNEGLQGYTRSSAWHLNELSTDALLIILQSVF